MAQANRIAKAFKLQKYFKGLPKETDVKLVEETLPALKNGEFLAKAVYISVDPYVRSFSKDFKLGETVTGTQIARIIESKNDEYPIGEHVVGEFGWRTHTVASKKLGLFGFPAPWIIPNFGGLPLTLALGILGMPGNTAYFGMLELCNPQPGKTVVVTGAGGAVGSVAGQIAKIKGSKVIGIVGTDEKGKWITEQLGFNHFINYKTSNVSHKLSEFAPNGVDCFFDNVGGEIGTTVMHKMNKFGRVCVSGSISSYNSEDDSLPQVSENQTLIEARQLKVERMAVRQRLDQWFEGINQNLQWIQEGKLKYRETVTDGFENIFKAFVGMLQGANIGKAIVKVE